MLGDALRALRRLRHAGALLAMLCCGLLAYGSSVERAHAVELRPAFTWKLPGGYAGDPPENGLVPETSPDSIEAHRWLLDTVVDPALCDPGASYSWSTRSGPIPSMRRGLCKYTLELPERGTYAVALTAEVKGRREQETRDVDVDGRLIVAIGDSIASGEGVPDTRGAVGGDWQSRQCHRSARAAPALAAQMLQRSVPQTPITFIHLACSGATILQGLLGSYEGIAPRRGEAPLEPQVDVLDSLQTRRSVDAVLISIGANDVHFSEVIKLCTPLLHPLRFRSCLSRGATLEGKRYATLEQGLLEATSKLPRHYALLHAALAGIPGKRIYLMQYYDPTHAADGSTCGQILGIGRDVLDRARKLVLEPLNRIGEEAARRYGWHYIGGIARLFDHHGYCVKGREGWVVKASGSLSNGSAIAGTMHPNAAGHRAIATVLADALSPALYPAATRNKSTGGTSTGNVPKRMSTNAEIVAWVCFGLGVVILLGGVAVGLVLSFRKTAKSVSAKDASAKVKDAVQQVEALKATAVAGAENPASDAQAAKAASTQADSAQSVLQEIGGIISALPESLRFAGLLVLIGTALISVATVQFGGHSLF